MTGNGKMELINNDFGRYLFNGRTIIFLCINFK